MNTEQDLLKTLRNDHNEAASLFSNAGQPLQERTAVAGFLRLLGIEYSDPEIVKRGPEPVDVHFRDARFQVTEILDEGRRRDQEVRERARRIQEATRLDDLWEPRVISSSPIPSSELVGLVSERSKAKARRYGGRQDDVDLLVYVNLQRRHVVESQRFPDFPADAALGWRSISVVMEHFAIVLWAAAGAPSFLIQRVGQPVLWEKGPESVFPRIIPD